MKNFFLTSFSLALLALIFLVIFLSTKGYETDRFNSLISNKIKDSGENLEVDLEKMVLAPQSIVLFKSSHQDG